MKKLILLLGLIATSLSLTNCTKDDVCAPIDEVKGDFTLYASVTRTANDGLNTKWTEGDALNVFHVITSETTYTNDNSFNLSDAASGCFLGTLTGALDTTSEYDWYAIYPYSKYITSPNNTGSGYSYIGGRSDAKQSQMGNNSMAHIAGTNYPMVGYATAVPASTSPHLVFTHASSLVEFEVVNKLSESITVSEIQFTTQESIIGTFYINFADHNNITYKNGDYVSNTMTLAVANGDEIAPGASAKFYAAIKPFTAQAGSELSIKISASSESGLGSHEQDITLSKDVTFSAGKIKNVKVNYATQFEVSESETWNLISSLDEITSGTYVIVAKQKGGEVIAYCPSTTSASGPTQVTTTLFDLETPSFSSNAVPADARWTFTGDHSGLTIQNSDGKYLYNTSANNGVRVGDTKDVWVITTAKNNAFNLKDETQGRYLTLYSTTNWRCYTSPYDFGNKDQNSECYLYKLNDGVVTITPVLTVTPNTIEGISYEGGNATITYTVTNPVNGVTATATSDQDWVAITPADGAFNLTIAANDGDAREATITVSYEGAISRTVKVSQDAKPNENGSTDIILDFESISNKVSSYTTTWKQSCGDYTWNIVNFNNNNAGWKYIKCGRKNNASVASINTTFSIPWAVSNVVVTIDAVTTSKINSTYLQVATDANFSNIVETVEVTIKKGDLTYTVTNPGANYYYKLVYDCASGTSNGLVTISKVVYTAAN